MDDSSPLTEPRPEQTNNAAATPHDAANGDTKPAAPRSASRTITSKRVVIPASAKKSAHVPPTPVAAPVADTPVIPIEPPPAATGETPDSAVTPPLADAAPALVSEQLEAAPAQETPSAEPLADAAVVTAAATTAAASAPPTLSPPAYAPTSASELRPEPVTRKTSSTPTAGGIKPGSMPYAPTPANFTPLAVGEPPRKRRTLEWVLWLGAALLLIIAAIAIVPLLFPELVPGGVPETAKSTPTEIAIIQPTAGNTPKATTTLLPTTQATDVVIVPTNAPLVIPTPPVDGSQASLVADAALTGWISTDEQAPHYGDDNLHAGTFQGKNLSSILQFNLQNLPQDTKILFAALELTGRDASRLGSGGEWQLDLLENALDQDWFAATPQDLAEAKSLGKIGNSLIGDELGVGRVNRFILTETERQMLEQQFRNGSAVFRLRGPVSSSDNLFTWESGASGSALNAPTLHIVFEPGRYVIVTNTPEPQNVLTAAAYVVRGTDQAKRLGTPTPFPPGVATATPGGEIIIVPAETGIAQNSETAAARAALATAIARTTGTYTPTQPFVILFPTNTPAVIAPAQLATATPIPPDTDLLTIPIDYETCNCQGRILALSNRYGGDRPTTPIMMEPDGTELGKLSGDLYYKLALAREAYSPDRKRRLIYPMDSNGIQQIGFENIDTGDIVFLTNFPKGIAYDAAWSPDGNYVAFVSTERGNTDELWVYDFATETSARITDSSELGQPWNKHPTWSPDSQQIAFWSSRSGNRQIWVINRDGSNPVNISKNSFTEIDPVWVK